MSDVAGSGSEKLVVVLTPESSLVADEGRPGGVTLAEPHCARSAIATPAAITRPHKPATLKANS